MRAEHHNNSLLHLHCITGTSCNSPALLERHATLATSPPCASRLSSSLSSSSFASSMLLAVRLSSVTLNDLRARAAGGSRAPPPAAATLLRRHRASPGPRAGLAAAVAEVYRSPVAAARGSSSSDGAPSSLHRSVRKALDAKRPLIAAHLLAEEWALTCKSLDDPALR